MSCIITRKSTASIRGRLHHCQTYMRHFSHRRKLPHANHETHLHTMKVVTIIIPSFYGLHLVPPTPPPPPQKKTNKQNKRNACIFRVLLCFSKLVEQISWFLFFYQLDLVYFLVDTFGIIALLYCCPFHSSLSLQLLLNLWMKPCAVTNQIKPLGLNVSKFFSISRDFLVNWFCYNFTNNTNFILKYD